MSNKVKYVHTGLIARDWRRMVAFYVEVFGFTRTDNHIDASGEIAEELTNIPEVAIRGTHLGFPGCPGVTMEILEYAPPAYRAGESAVNDQGFTHLAFEVASIPEVLEKMRAHGCDTLGEEARMECPDGRTLTLVFARDPEGNVIELQSFAD